MLKNDILKKAKEVNDISMGYHLGHAILACNKLTEDAVKKFNGKKLSDLQRRALVAHTEEDRASIRRDMDSLKNPYRIHVEYVNGMPEDGARVVRLPASNQLVIEMPQCFLDNAINENGWYKTPEAVKRLRRAKAHELGHIVLNLEALMSNEGTQGSKDIDDIASEDDANVFADELLRLRKDRNKKLYNDSTMREAF